MAQNLDADDDYSSLGDPDERSISPAVFDDICNGGSHGNLTCSHLIVWNGARHSAVRRESARDGRA